MDPFNQQNTSKTKSQTQQNSSFANALAELERPLGTPMPSGVQQTQNDLLSQAMARTGGNIDPYQGLPFDSNIQNNTFSNFQGDSLQNANTTDFSQAMAQQQEQQRAMEEEQNRIKKEALRKKLHDQVNPVETFDIFNAKEERVKEQIEMTRKEIEGLANDLKKLHKEIDIEASKVVVKPGTEGTYYESYFQKLRNFIMLLRQKVKSANTWMKQANAKKAKRKRSKRPGLEVGGAQHEQTKTVFDMMNHERSSTYGGS